MNKWVNAWINNYNFCQCYKIIIKAIIKRSLLIIFINDLNDLRLTSVVYIRMYIFA